MKSTILPIIVTDGETVKLPINVHVDSNLLIQLSGLKWAALKEPPIFNYLIEILRAGAGTLRSAVGSQSSLERSQSGGIMCARQEQFQVGINLGFPSRVANHFVG